MKKEARLPGRELLKGPRAGEGQIRQKAWSLRPIDLKEDSMPTCHTPVSKGPQEAAHTSVSGNIFILQVFL